jgi:hypothetical protein
MHIDSGGGRSDAARKSANYGTEYARKSKNENEQIVFKNSRADNQLSLVDGGRSPQSTPTDPDLCNLQSHNL